MRVDVPEQAKPLARHHLREEFPAFEGHRSLAHPLAFFRAAPGVDEGLAIVFQTSANEQSDTVFQDFFLRSSRRSFFTSARKSAINRSGVVK